MKIIDKYIFRQTVIGYLTILISLTILIWLTQSLRMIDMIVTKGVSIGIFIEMTLLVLPNFLQILSPLALFGVALFVFIRMQSDKELIVLKAVGMNAKQLIKPLFMLGGFLVLLGYLLTLWLIPSSYSEMRQMKWKIQNNLAHLLLQEGQFNSFKNGMTLYIRERESAGQIKGILAHEIKKDKKSILIAESGTMIQTPNGISLTFNNGTRQEFNTKTKEFSVLKFDKNTILFETSTKKSDRKIDPREMSLSQLIKTKQNEVNDAPTYRKYKVEAFKRLTQPLYNLLFLWLAAFGVLSGHYNRRGQSHQINTVVITVVLLQSFSLAFENIATRNLWGLILMGANLFIPLGILYLTLFKEKKIGWIHLILALTLGCTSYSAQAAPKLNLGNINSKAPIDFEADHISYDTKNNILTAEGNVILNQNKMEVTTEKILYNQKQEEVKIPQETLIILADGTKTTVQEMVLYPQKSEAAANTITSMLTDGSRITAEQMLSTQNGDVLTFKNATYTPCDTCQSKTPIWQIDAKKVTQDFKNHTLSYKHMFLDIKDVPILYFPYFQMPDLTIKRKTGFLNPSIRHTHEMGLSIETPIFVDLATNQNLLFTPIISANHMPLGLIEYQGKFAKGILNVQLSGTQDKNKENEAHIKTNFEYDFSSNLRFTGQYFRTLSDTYFRRYDIQGINDSESFLRSHFTAEYFGNNFYTKARALHFQSLLNEIDSNSLPIVIPTIQMQYTTKPLFNTKLYGFTKFNTALYNTREHFKSNRATIIQGFAFPHTTSFGLVSETKASFRLDGYVLDSGTNDLVSKHQNDSYNKGRFTPIISTKLSYPLIATTKNTTHVLEPIMMLILSPNTKNSENIPNIDSTVFNFDDTNLFSENRFAGYDRIETGSRLNYGLQWTAYHNNAQNRSLSILFGQVYRFNNSSELTDVMGYNNHLSDYVGNIQLNYPHFNLHYRFRLNRENLAKRKNDIGFSVGKNPLRIGINYLYQGAYTLDNKNYNEENEIHFWLKSNLSKNWQTSGYYRYNLKKEGGPIEYGIQLRYDNECTAVVFELDKSYAKDRNYKGSTSFMVKVLLKTLGGIGE